MVRLRGTGRRSEKGFTLVELLIVISIMAILMGMAVIVYQGTLNRTDARSAVEMIKEDIRKVYALADSGEIAATAPTPGLSSDPRIAYGIQFRYSSSTTPNNCYRIVKGTPNVLNPVAATDYTWAVVPREKSTTFGTATGEWIKVSNQVGFQIVSCTSTTPVTANGEVNQTLVWKPQGSTLKKLSDGESVLTVSGGGKTYTITVSQYGSVGSTLE